MVTLFLSCFRCFLVHRNGWRGEGFLDLWIERVVESVDVFLGEHFLLYRSIFALFHLFACFRLLLLSFGFHHQRCDSPDELPPCFIVGFLPFFQHGLAEPSDVSFGQRDSFHHVVLEMLQHVLVGQLFEEDRRKSQREPGFVSFLYEIVQGVQERDVGLCHGFVDHFLAMGPSSGFPYVWQVGMEDEGESSEFFGHQIKPPASVLSIVAQNKALATSAPGLVTCFSGGEGGI